jgi:hypothetical protein
MTCIIVTFNPFRKGSFTFNSESSAKLNPTNQIIEDKTNLKRTFENEEMINSSANLVSSSSLLSSKKLKQDELESSTNLITK